MCSPLTYIRGRGSYWCMYTSKFRSPRCCSIRFTTGFRSVGAKRPLLLVQAQPGTGLDSASWSAPGITGTFVILFANAMGAYATAYALVGGNFNLLAIRIGSLVAGDVSTKPQLGSALAVLLGLMMLVALTVSQWFMRRVRKDLA